jgi:hypothetical protein
MGAYEPKTVGKLADVVLDICKALEQEACELPLDKRKGIALRVMELYECGITDRDRLLFEIMADSMWASSQLSRR